MFNSKLFASVLVVSAVVLSSTQISASTKNLVEVKIQVDNLPEWDSCSNDTVGKIEGGWKINLAETGFPHWMCRDKKGKVWREKSSIGEG